MSTNAKPSISMSPEPAVKHREQGIRIFMWPKVIFLYPTAVVVRSDWTRRLESGTKTVGMLAFFAVALWLLARPLDDAAPEGVPDTSARTLENEEAVR